MAKHAESSSQLMVPQAMMRPIWVQLRRTAVIQAVTRSIRATVSPSGLPVRATDSFTAHDSTAWSGRS